LDKLFEHSVGSFVISTFKRRYYLWTFLLHPLCALHWNLCLAHMHITYFWPCIFCELLATSCLLLATPSVAHVILLLATPSVAHVILLLYKNMKYNFITSTTTYEHTYTHTVPRAWSRVT